MTLLTISIMNSHSNRRRLAASRVSVILSLHSSLERRRASHEGLLPLAVFSWPVGFATGKAAKTLLKVVTKQIQFNKLK